MISVSARIIVQICRPAPMRRSSANSRAPLGGRHGDGVDERQCAERCDQAQQRVDLERLMAGCGRERRSYCARVLTSRPGYRARTPRGGCDEARRAAGSARHEDGVVERMGDVAGDERTRKHDLGEAEGAREGRRDPQRDRGAVAQPEPDTVAEVPPESRRAVRADGERVAVQIAHRPGGDAEVDHAVSEAASTPRAGNARRLAPSAATTTDVASVPDAWRIPGTRRATAAVEPGDNPAADGALSTKFAVVRSAVWLAACCWSMAFPKKTVATSETASTMGVATEATRRRLARAFARASRPGPLLSRAERQPDQPHEWQREQRPKEGDGDHPDHRGRGRAVLAPPAGCGDDGDAARQRRQPGKPAEQVTGRRCTFASRNASVGRMRDARRALANAAS